MEFLKKYSKSALFIFFAFFISWLMFGVFFLMGGRWNTVQAQIMMVCYMFSPLLSAVIVQKGIYREPLKAYLGISFRLNRWYFAAWFIMPLITLLAISVSIAFPSVTFDPSMESFFQKYASVLKPEQLTQMKEQMLNAKLLFFFIGILQALVAGITINAVAAFGEEAGWRGLLIREYSGKKFWDATLRIGLIWGLWHAPVIAMGYNYPDHPALGVFMMIVWCILLSALFNYFRIKAKSVIAAAFIHGTTNAVAGLALLYISGGNDIIVGLTGVSGFIAILLALAILFILDRYVMKDNIFTSTMKIPVNEEDNEITEIQGRSI